MSDANKIKCLCDKCDHHFMVDTAHGDNECPLADCGGTLRIVETETKDGSRIHLSITPDDLQTLIDLVRIKNASLVRRHMAHDYLQKILTKLVARLMGAAKPAPADDAESDDSKGDWRRGRPNCGID